MAGMGFFLLTACGETAERAPAEPGAAPGTETTAAPMPVLAVATTDEPIVLPSPATGLAFWEHPSLPFEGMVIAATENGLFAHQPEGKEAETIVSTFRAHGAALTYLPGPLFVDEPDTANRVMSAQALFVSYDLDQSAYRFFGIDNISGILTEDFLSLPVRTQRSKPADFCLMAAQGEETALRFTLVALEADAVSVYRFAQTASAVGGQRPWSIASETYPTSLTALSCANDPGTDRLLILDDVGTVHGFNPATGITNPLFDTGIEGAAGLGVHRRGLAETAAGDLEKLTFVVDSTSGQVTLFRLPDGAPVGAIKLTAFDVNEGVIETSALAVASGNFGGLYRAGVVALAARSNFFEAEPADPAPQSQEADDKAEIPVASVNAIRLTPFVAVRNALELTPGTVIGARQRDQTASSGVIVPPIVDIELDLAPVTP